MLFRSDRPISIPGQGYKFTSRDYTAANTATDTLGRRHHIVAKGGVWTQEAQYEDGLILTTDQNADLTLTEINGEYERNWDDFGDSNVRKELPSLALVGDGEPSTVLSNASPLTVEWYADFEEVKSANKKTVAFTKSPQDSPSYIGKLTSGLRFWYKIAIKLAGHSTDSASFATHSDPSTEGDKGAGNFYGAVVRLMAHLANTQNRV